MTQPSAADSPAAFLDCLQLASQMGAELVRLLTDQAADRMRQRIAASQDIPRRLALEDALKLLLRHQEQLVQVFPSHLLAACQEAMRPVAQRADAGPSFEQLELMAETQVQESVELARAQQAAMLAVEDRLGELNALVCGARGLRTVQPSHNPLRPEVYARALHAALGRFGLEAPVRLVWMQALGEGLGAKLRNVYDRLCERLRAQGVTPASYGVTQGPATGPAPGPAAGPASGSTAAQRAPGTPRADADATPRLTMAQLHRLIASGAPAAPAATAADPDETVPAALEALHAMAQADAVIARMSAPRARAGAAAPAAGGDTAAWVAELGAEVVGVMVDAIAADPRLLPAVRKQVGALRPALLRLVREDPRFFVEDGHPARQFLELVTSRALAWASDSEPGLADFLRMLAAAVARLNASGATAPDFAAVGQSLAAEWDRQQQRQREAREHAVQVLLRAERRNALAAQVAAELRARPDSAGVPEDVLRFLTGPWAQVIAQARLDDPSLPDPNGLLGTTADLLWSCRPERAGRNRNRLVRVVPRLLQQLREGLRLVGYPQAELGAFFQILMGLHEQGLRNPAPPAAGAPAAPAHEPDAPAPEPEAPVRLSKAQLEAQLAAADAPPWVAPHEAQDSGFLDDLDTAGAADGASGFSSTLPQQADEPPAAPGRIALGTWVEAAGPDGRWQRLQVCWWSPQGHMLMLAAADGSARSMTRRMFEASLARGSVRVLAAQSPVRGALDEVTRTALRNSVDTTY